MSVNDNSGGGPVAPGPYGDRNDEPELVLPRSGGVGMSDLFDAFYAAVAANPDEWEQTESFGHECPMCGEMMGWSVRWASKTSRNGLPEGGRGGCFVCAFEKEANR